jgi:outer membrane receptor for ferrienterochelin and colicins
MQRNHQFHIFCLVWLSALVCLAVVPSYGQHQQFFVTIFDKKSNEPVSYANVLVEGLKSGEKKYFVSSVDGKIPNEIREISRISITCVGYKTLFDTISPGQDFKIRMDPSVLDIEEVVVTAQYSPERADKSIYKVEVINARQIEQKAANTMADLLRDQVNMRVSQAGVLGTNLSMQGLSGENVKFLVDGVPMIGRMQGNIDLNQINLSNVDHVEVIEGPMSVIYGSNALAGVVNIISKENKTSLLKGYANGYYESSGVSNFDGGISAKFNQNGIALDGGRNFFGGYSVAGSDTGRSQTYKPRRQYFFDGYYTYTQKILRIKLAGQYFNELLEDKGNLLPPYYETAFDSYFTTIRYTGRIEATLTLPKSHYLTFIGAYSYYSRVKEKYFKDLTTMNEVLTTNPDDQDTTGITSWLAKGTYSKNNPEKKLNYQAGFDFNIESGEGKRILDYSQQIGDYALFGSVKWNPVRRLSLQPGVRLIYNSKYSAPVVYALSGKWSFNDFISARVSYSKGFRAPSIKELYLYFVDVNHNVQGNPDLGSETSNNINLDLVYGREKSRFGWSAELSGFYNHVNNIITLAQSQSNSSLYTYINVDKFNSVSGQFGLCFKLNPSLVIQVGVAETGRSYQQSNQNNSSDFFFSTDVSANASYSFIKYDMTFALYYKYTGKSPQFQFEEETITEAYVDPYNTMDFTFSKGFLDNLLRVSTGVKNIFNVVTVPATGGVSGGGAHGSGGNGSESIGWGRTVFLKLSINFNKVK